MTKKFRFANVKSNSGREQIISTLNEKYHSMYLSNMPLFQNTMKFAVIFCANKFNKKMPVINIVFYLFV